MVLVGGVLVLSGVLLAWVWWLRRTWLVATVHGLSMMPTYRDGDRVLVRRVAAARLRVGQVVVADLPVTMPAEGTRLADMALEQVADSVETEVPVVWSDSEFPLPAPEASRVVKRIAAVAGDPRPDSVEAIQPVVPTGKLVLLGDNPTQSADSRLYGYVSTDTVLGIVVRPIRSGRP